MMINRQYLTQLCCIFLCVCLVELSFLCAPGGGIIGSDGNDNLGGIDNKSTIYEKLALFRDTLDGRPSEATPPDNLIGVLIDIQGNKTGNPPSNAGLIGSSADVDNMGLWQKIDKILDLIDSTSSPGANTIIEAIQNVQGDLSGNWGIIGNIPSSLATDIRGRLKDTMDLIDDRVNPVPPAPSAPTTIVEAIQNVQGDLSTSWGILGDLNSIPTVSIEGDIYTRLYDTLHYIHTQLGTKWINGSTYAGGTVDDTFTFKDLIAKIDAPT